MPKHLTLTQAKKLTYRTILEHRTLKNADGTPARYVVNGAPRTWVRAPSRVSIPVKRGLYEYGTITESDLENFTVQGTS